MATSSATNNNGNGNDHRYISLSKGAGATLKFVKLSLDGVTLTKLRGPPGAVEEPYSFTFKAESVSAANAVFDSTVTELYAKGYTLAHEHDDSKRASVAHKRARSSSPSPARDRPKKGASTPKKKPIAAASAASRSASSSPPPPSQSLPVPKKSKILKGLHICISGALSMLRVKFQEYLRQHGAGIAASVNGSCTHLISTEDDVKFKRTSKTTKASSMGIPIVTEQWIHDCLRSAAIISTKRYIISDDDNDTSDPFSVDVANDNNDDKPSAKRAKTETKKIKKHKHVNSDNDNDNNDQDHDDNDNDNDASSSSSSSRAVKREQKVKREKSDDDNDNNHDNNGAAASSSLSMDINDFKPIISTTSCYRMYNVDSTISLQQLLKSMGLTMRSCVAFYELMDHKERIKADKSIVLVSKSSDSIVFDDNIISRELLGVTNDNAALITRAVCPDYYVFISSHLASRKLDASTRMLIKADDNDRTTLLRMQANHRTTHTGSLDTRDTKDVKVKIKVESRDDYNIIDDEREHKAVPSSSSSSSVKKPITTWTCSECTLDNNNNQSKCSACNNPRRKVVGKYPWGLKWTLEEPTFMVLDSKDVPPSSRIIGFDMDSTLIETKSGKKFPTGQNDWQWLDDGVPDMLREKYGAGYKLVIFTNQAGIKKGKTNSEHIKGKILDIIKQVGVPMQACIAAASNWYRKPATTMWDHIIQSCNHSILPDLTQCLYVGDAAGRPKGWRDGAAADFSVADRAFAHNIGVSFLTPEEFFHGEKPVKFSWKTYDPADLLKMAQKKIDEHGGAKAHGYCGKLPLILGRQELIIFTGSPACGKSTFARSHLVPAGYTRVNQDELKTKAKCLTACRTAIASGKCVVIDNTNPEVTTRKEYINIAKEYDVPVRCFWFDTPRALTEHLNLYREKISRGERERLPGMVLNIWHGKFAEPTSKEGYLEVARVLFVPTFPTPLHRTIFLQRIAPER